MVKGHEKQERGIRGNFGREMGHVVSGGDPGRYISSPKGKGGDNGGRMQ